jgi:hypothetical protein
VDLQHPAVLAHAPHRVEQRLIAEPEVEHHEGLRCGDAGIDGGGQLGERIVGMA